VQAVKERFDDAGIDIPYPNRELSGTVDIPQSVTATADDD
jgi:small conductance mechanosensitive channel